MELSCNPALLPSADYLVSWVATHLRTAWLTPVALFFSALVKKDTIFLSLALLYWFWNKQYARYITYATCCSFLLNAGLKVLVLECRPPKALWLTLVGPASYSFPSGHAQVGMTFWGGMAYYLKSRWLACLLLMIGLTIGLSRIYLGVHYVHDVIAGYLLAASVLAIVIFFEKRYHQGLSAPLWVQATFLLTALVIYSAFYASKTFAGELLGIVSTAFFFGFWLGCQWESRTLQFSCKKTCYQYALQFCIGVGGGILLIKLPSAHLLLLQYTQYFLAGMWISYGAPWVFIKCKLADSYACTTEYSRYTKTKISFENG